MDKHARKIIAEYFSKLGRKGGKKGGPARAQTLTPKRRSEIASLGAATRWKRRAK